jgi:hypothetical protein
MTTRTLPASFQVFDARNEAIVHIRFIRHTSGTIHATMFTGRDRQTIAVQRGYFFAITGTSPDAVLGCVEVSLFIAAAIGFTVNLAEGVESA